MRTLPLQLQHEFRQINKFRTLSLLGFVLMLMATPLFFAATQQNQDIRQRAQTSQNVIIVDENGQVASGSSQINASQEEQQEAEKAAYAAADAAFYPEISPWVFIIPGIIILLVILFH